MSRGADMLLNCPAAGESSEGAGPIGEYSGYGSISTLVVLFIEIP